jgi:hypothetical protein
MPFIYGRASRLKVVFAEDISALRPNVVLS